MPSYTSSTRSLEGVTRVIASIIGLIYQKELGYSHDESPGNSQPVPVRKFRVCTEKCWETAVTRKNGHQK